MCKSRIGRNSRSGSGGNEPVLGPPVAMVMPNGRECFMQDSQDIQPFQITKAWARNFRSMADTSVELDRLTVLVGPNAAGKSNVLDILRFIKDALRFDLEAAISLRHGPGAIQYRSEQGQASEIELGLTALERRRHSSFTLDYHFVIAINADGDFRVRQERVLVRPDALGQSFERPPY